MQFIHSSRVGQEVKKLKDLADNNRLSAIIKEEHKMEAKMKRRAGVNQRLEDEFQAAETMRLKKEKEENEAKAFKWAQQEKLAAELENIKREEFVELKLRQQLRERSVELRELQSQLLAAYVNKDLAAQIEERNLARMHEKIEVQRERELLKKMSERDKAIEEKEKQDELMKNIQYRKELQEQRQVISDEAYQQFLRDKQMMDDIVRLIHEEAMREREMKMIEMKKTREEMDQFRKARELWRERERRASEEEDRRLVEYWNKKDAEVERLAEEQKRIKELADKRREYVIEHVRQLQYKDESLQNMLDELQKEERKAETDERERAEFEATIRRKIEAKISFEAQRREKQEQMRYEKQLDDALKEELLKKFAEDARLEQMTKERRRQMMLNHKKEIEDIIFERQRKRIEEEHATKEIERMEEEETKRKHKMIEEERLRMLQEHAKNLIGYLPKGLLRPTDFPHVGPEFMEKKDKPYEC